MIENELQYDLTRAAAEPFKQALAELSRRPLSEDDVHPLLSKAQEDAIRSVPEALRAELRAYDLHRSNL